VHTLDRFLDWLFLERAGKMPGAVVAAVVVILDPGVSTSHAPSSY
jgi:hypothetical protein